MSSSEPQPSAPPPRPDIRFGIMCNGTRFPSWQATAIRRLLSIPGVEASLLIVPASPGTAVSVTGRLGRIGSLLADRCHLLWNLFNKGYVERRSRASRSVDLSTDLDGVPTLPCATVPVGRFGEAFSPGDVAAIRAHDLDFVLRFGFGIVKGEVLEAARYGLWSYHHGDEQRYRGRPPGFWELVDGEDVVGAILQRLTERLDGGIVLHRGTFRAVPYSYVRTRDEAFSGSSDWAAVVCRSIMSGDLAQVTAAASATKAPVRHNPGNVAMLRFLARQAVAFVVNQWRGLTRAAKWTIGVADVPIESFLTGDTPPIRWIREYGATRYLADPFPLPGGSDVALVEDYDYRTHRGVIAAVPLDGAGRPRPVIDPGVHASYPYLFEADGAVWCAPEIYQAGELRLYRAVSFPDEWEHVATPVTGLGVLDPTFWHHEGRWWIFATDHADGPNTKLRIWHSTDLLSGWEPHPLNPVKTDVRSSRSAGTPFVVDGTLFRPAQDGSHSYGGGITINRVDVLTPTAFSEEAVARVPPPDTGRYRHGIHTLSAAGDRTVVDGRRDIFIAASFKRELTGRLGKFRRR